MATTVTKREVKVLSAPACSPRYPMIIPAGTAVEFVRGKPVVAPVDFHKVKGGNSFDLAHYYVWLPEDVV